jgi:alanine-glyoxylate transaminase / serine-glyoxylate transaminase / serine-pyruvate transaminase
MEDEMKKHSLLMIPGPIEFEAEVLAALGAPTTSHLAPEFIEAFGDALEQLRQVFACEFGQPLILAGTGTLAMDSVGANLVEPGDQALVVNHGYFGDRYGAILERYGARVTHVEAAVGGRPTLEAVEAALAKTSYKLMTITHVDTSTGVIADVQALAAAGRKHGALVVVDGVCSAAGETLLMDEWGVDAALTASQKAVGVPPGLALIVAGQRAIQAFEGRKTPVLNYYADWTNWLPVMQAYEARKPSYFATPAVNLVFALHTSLKRILAEGMAARVERHAALSAACKAGMRALGLIQVPVSDEAAAHTMTAPRFPAGVNGPQFLASAAQAGVTLAGGLHPAIRAEYFRIGHMGAVQLGDILATLSAVELALAAQGVQFRPGSSLEMAQAAFMNAGQNK